jgi:hypothetical protein
MKNFIMPPSELNFRFSPASGQEKGRRRSAFHFLLKLISALLAAKEVFPSGHAPFLGIPPGYIGLAAGVLNHLVYYAIGPPPIYNFSGAQCTLYQTVEEVDQCTKDE